MKHKLLTTLLIVFTTTVALLFLFFRSPTPNTFSFEIAKALLQLGVVAVVGAVVSLAMTNYQLEQGQRDKDREREHQTHVKEREVERQRREYREELLVATLSRTVAAYGQTKKARRLLRARCGPGQSGPCNVQLDEYDKYMEAINDAQLELESLKGDVMTSKPAFTDASSIASLLEAMEKYLGKLIKEYEANRHALVASKGSIPIGNLKRLKDFLTPADEQNAFKLSVIDSYHEVQKRIRSDLLHPRLPQQ